VKNYHVQTFQSVPFLAHSKSIYLQELK